MPLPYRQIPPNLIARPVFIAALSICSLLAAGLLAFQSTEDHTSLALPLEARTAEQFPIELPAPGSLADAAPAHESLQVRPGDTLARLLGQRGLDGVTIHALMEASPVRGALSSIKAGNAIELTTAADGTLLELSYAPDLLRVITIRRNEAGEFEGTLTEKEALAIPRYAEGVVADSLFASGKKAGVGDGVILKIADIFGYDVDFALEVRNGDTFRVLYEEIVVDGKRIRDGEVLSAEFVNQGKRYQAVRFTGSNKHASYYTPDGNAMRKAFLRSPVDFARISSRFNPNRMHPILHTLRAHKGVDYAAPRGTPIRATANGRVDYAGNKGGYGKTIILQHANQYSTLYAHLDRFAPGVRNGSRISQGQIIGYIGTSGLSSGPHLHYEFRISGRHVDPLKAKPAQAEPIAVADRQAFLAEAGRLMAMMDNLGGRTAVVQTNGKLPAKAVTRPL